MRIEKRSKYLRGAVYLELLSVGWVMTEAVMSAVAAIAMNSLAMSAFSIDSAIELISGVVLVVRLWVELQTGSDSLSQKVERIASGVVGVCLFTLAGYIAWKSGQSLALQRPLVTSPLGLAIAAASSLITPWLAARKQKYGKILHSHALLGDAACSLICAYMAWTLLAGLLLQWAFGWWWVDPVAAVGILYFVLREAWESVDAAWSGEGHVHAH